MSKHTRERYQAKPADAPPPETPDDSDDFKGDAQGPAIDFAEQVAKYLQEDGYTRVGTRGEVVSLFDAQAITVEAAIILSLARRVRKVLGWQR